MASSDRQSSLLTQNQRDVLRGDAEISDRGKRAAHTRVRERVRAGLRDIPLLVETGAVTPEDVVEDFNSQELGEVLRSQIALSYQLATTSELDFYEIVGDGIDQAKRGRIQSLKRRFERGDPSLTAEELALLGRREEISRLERKKYLDSIGEGSDVTFGPLDTISKMIREESIDQVNDDIEDAIEEATNNSGNSE